MNEQIGMEGLFFSDLPDGVDEGKSRSDVLDSDLSGTLAGIV